MKPYNHALGVRENMPTRLRLMEMHPYPRFAVLLLKGSMSLDSQSSTTPYESSSFATPEGEVYSPLSFRTHKQLKA